jgi:predicted dinucleotide-binding enzyme
MKPFRIYKKIQPTYGEWFSILAELGYQKQIVDRKNPISKRSTKQYVLENSSQKSTIILPYLPNNEPIVKAYFANYSHQLYSTRHH